jgi:hypothetical protein
MYYVHYYQVLMVKICSSFLVLANMHEQRVVSLKGFHIEVAV